jgi:hypothetical protein
MRVFLAVTFLALIASPAWAEKYNIVCSLPALGTAQAGGATVNRGHIYSLDFDAMQACVRDGGACVPEAFAVGGGLARLPAADEARVEFDLAANQLKETRAEDAISGPCRRAPFTAFPQ